jgi:hypothetical protein
MGALKPVTPQGLSLQVHLSTKKLKYSETLHDRGFQEALHPDELKWLKKYAYRQIKRFSHARTKCHSGIC